MNISAFYYMKIEIKTRIVIRPVAHKRVTVPLYGLQLQLYSQLDTVNLL